MTVFPGFPQAGGAPPTAPDRTVCIVTSELVGPFKNGGIGTSMTGLAQTLAAAGYNVTVLYTGTEARPVGESAIWERRYRAIGIEIVWLPTRGAPRLAGPVADQGGRIPYLVYEYLRRRPFDIVQFNDCMGEGFYALAMKRLGLAMRDTVTCVALHSPSQWIFEVNRTALSQAVASVFNYAERLSVAAADVLWSPSHYLLDWAVQNGFAVPPATYVQQYVIPYDGLFAGAAPARREARPGGAAVPREIVFFGRIEERKGVDLFVRALGRLNARLANSGVRVTFLGKYGAVGDASAENFLRTHSSEWRFDWGAITDLGQQEALAYLREEHVVAVMASPADNSPCTVYEALAEEIRFIAARTGGIPELILPADHDRALFDHDVAALVARLERVLDEGLAPVRPAVLQAENRRRWATIFGQLTAIAPADPPPGKPAPWWAVIDHAAGSDLDRTLLSLASESIDRILILDRTPASPARVLPANAAAIDLTSGPELVRAELARAGDSALLFLPSGARLIFGQLERAAAALNTSGIDGLMPAVRLGSDDRAPIIPPLGSSQSFCFLEGACHAGALIVRADRLASVVTAGGMVAGAPFLNLPDLAVAGGLTLWPLAEPLIETATAPPKLSLAQLRVPARVAAYAGATAVERHYIMSIGLFAPAVIDARRLARMRLVRDLLIRMRAGWAVKLARRAIPARVIGRMLGR